MILAEGLRVIDAVHIEHADAAIPDAQRQRERRGDVAIGLEVLTQRCGGSIVREDHSLLLLRHPSSDPLAQALAGIARELGLQAIRCAGLV